MNRNDLAFRSGDRLASVGMALDTIANLLGADGSEHHLTPSDRNGLIHAVRAFADQVRRSGYDLAEAFDPDPLPVYQEAVQDLDRALAASSQSTAQRKGGAK